MRQQITASHLLVVLGVELPTAAIRERCSFDQDTLRSQLAIRAERIGHRHRRSKAHAADNPDKCPSVYFHHWILRSMVAPPSYPDDQRPGSPHFEPTEAADRGKGGHGCNAGAICRRLYLGRYGGITGSDPYRQWLGGLSRRGSEEPSGSREDTGARRQHAKLGAF